MCASAPAWTWVAYAKITNRPNALAEAKRTVAARKWRLRSFALVEIALKRANASDDVKTTVEKLRPLISEEN